MHSSLKGPDSKAAQRAPLSGPRSGLEELEAQGLTLERPIRWKALQIAFPCKDPVPRSSPPLLQFLLVADTPILGEFPLHLPGPPPTPPQTKQTTKSERWGPFVEPPLLLGKVYAF